MGFRPLVLGLGFILGAGAPAWAAPKADLDVGFSAYRGHPLKFFSTDKKIWGRSMVERWEGHLWVGSGSARGGFMLQSLRIDNTDIRGLWFGAEISDPAPRVRPRFRILTGAYRARRPAFREASYGGSLGMEFGLGVRVWRGLHLDLGFQWLAGIDHLQVDKPRVRAFATQTPLFGLGYNF